MVMVFATHSYMAHWITTVQLRTPLRHDGFGFNVRSCVMCPALAPLAYPDFTIFVCICYDESKRISTIV